MVLRVAPAPRTRSTRTPHLSSLAKRVFRLSVDDFPRRAVGCVGAHADLDRTWESVRPVAITLVDAFYATLGLRDPDAIADALDELPCEIEQVELESGHHPAALRHSTEAADRRQDRDSSDADPPASHLTGRRGEELQRLGRPDVHSHQLQAGHPGRQGRRRQHGERADLARPVCRRSRPGRIPHGPASRTADPAASATTPPRIASIGNGERARRP